MAHLHVVVRGRVQGVGYRHFVWSRARSLGLAGRVWNRPDGGVEVEAEGERQALEQLLEHLRQGPSAARVERVDEAWDQGGAEFKGFEIVG